MASKIAVASMALVLGLAWMSGFVNAQVVDTQISDRVSKTVSVLNEMAVSGDKGIPNELLQRAEAIAVFPGVIKGATDLGGSYGKGLVSERLADGRWTAPVFVRFGGGAWRPPTGVSSTDLVLVFTNPDALRTLEEGTDLKLGVDASIAAGPLGPAIDARADAQLETAVYGYSQSSRLFAGVSLDGAVLDIDDIAMHQVYGQDITARKVFLGETIFANSTVKPFIDALQRTTTGKKVSQTFRQN